MCSSNACYTDVFAPQEDVLALCWSYGVLTHYQIGHPSHRIATGLQTSLQAKLDHLEAELLELNSNSERLQRSHAELVELQLVLEKAGSFFDDAQFRASSSSAFDQRASQTDGKHPFILFPSSQTLPCLEKPSASFDLPTDQDNENAFEDLKSYACL